MRYTSWISANADQEMTALILAVVVLKGQLNLGLTVRTAGAPP